MKNKWVARLTDVNKELLLILSIIASAGIVNFFISGQRLVLTFYNLPTLFAAYYFGRRRAMGAAVASILFITWMNMMNPLALGGGLRIESRGLLTWSDLSVWAGFLIDLRLCHRDSLREGAAKSGGATRNVLWRAANSEPVHCQR